MIIKTGRFGQLTIGDQEVIEIPLGILGFPEYTKYCLVDSGDDTLILWLVSIQNPEIAFPVLEPKIFRSDYTVRLSGAELRELKLDNINQSAVFSILTLPEDSTQMTANLKAPLVINLRGQVGKQVVLQENEYGIKYPMFKELKAHLATIQSSQRVSQASSSTSKEGEALSSQSASAISIKDIPPSLTVRGLAL